MRVLVLMGRWGGGVRRVDSLEVMWSVGFWDAVGMLWWNGLGVEGFGGFE